MRLKKLHELYIENTKQKAFVTEVEVVLCTLTYAVFKGLKLPQSTSIKVYTNTKILKHLYDKKPAEEYDSILKNSYLVVKYPNKVYQNRDGKRGDFLFLKQLDNEVWLSSIENKNDVFSMVTCFRMRKESYLDSYKLIWSWKDDIPSS